MAQGYRNRGMRMPIAVSDFSLFFLPASILFSLIKPPFTIMAMKDDIVNLSYYSFFLNSMEIFPSF